MFDFTIIVSAIFINNIILAQFLGICPFIGVSKKLDTAIGMGAAVTFVMVIATIITYMVHVYILVPLNIGYLQTIAYIIIIASLVQFIETLLKKVSPALYQALGVFLPLITTNCAILGIALLVVQNEYNLLEGVVFALSTAIGFTVALVLFAGLRIQLELLGMPKGVSGTPIALITAGILAMAFMGFAGVV
jgi:electron transport complex protein RnfA